MPIFERLAGSEVAGAPGRTESSHRGGTASLLEAALDDPENGALIFDAQHRLLHATSQLFPLLGIRTEECVMTSDLLALLSHSSLDRNSLAVAKSKIDDFSTNVPGDSVLLHTQNPEKHIRMRLRDLGDQRRVATFQSELPSQPPSLQANESNLRDPVTGLASRPYFEQAICSALASSPKQAISILRIDLDRFKSVNDRLGRPAGDTLLRLAAERLRSAVREEDLIARLGANEFAVLIKLSESIGESCSIANRILDLVQRTYLIDGQLVNVGASIGIAESRNDGIDFVKLLRSADLARNHAKVPGQSNPCFFDPEMERRAQLHRTNEIELRQALALRQLEVFYQPQVNTETGRLFGFEALVRWRHPKRGLIPPNDFLPIAEEIGLMIPICEWVLRMACREAMNWPDDVTVAVNASPLQFDTDTLPDSVRRALTSSGLPGRRLEIEITEGILLKNDGIVLRVLQELREMDVHIAMDDFGTGYASLSQLAKFPFDKIKIDRSLAGFEGNDPKQRAIVRAITALGEGLNVCTLAEGVENADQIARLKKDGCSSVQGYFFGKPVPSSQLGEIISRLHPSFPTKPLILNQL